MTRLIIYIIACVTSFANLFWLGADKPFQLVLITMIFNILAAIFAWSGLLKNQNESKYENHPFQVFCWTMSALIWISIFMSSI